MEEKKKEKFAWGVTIMVLLGALTAGEYFIGVVGKNVGTVLMLVALFKAVLVIRDYMHVGKLFRMEGGEE